MTFQASVSRFAFYSHYDWGSFFFFFFFKLDRQTVKAHNSTEKIDDAFSLIKLKVRCLLYFVLVSVEILISEVYSAK